MSAGPACPPAQPNLVPARGEVGCRHLQIIIIPIVIIIIAILIIFIIAIVILIAILILIAIVNIILIITICLSRGGNLLTD